MGERIIGVCCLQEVRWRGHGARMLGMKEEDITCVGLKRRWIWYVRIMVKVELCEKVVEVRRVSDSDDCYSFSKRMC